MRFLQPPAVISGLSNPTMTSFTSYRDELYSAFSSGTNRVPSGRRLVQCDVVDEPLRVIDQFGEQIVRC